MQNETHKLLKTVVDGALLSSTQLCYIQTFLIRTPKGHTQISTLFKGVGPYYRCRDCMNFSILGTKTTVHNREVSELWRCPLSRGPTVLDLEI